LDVKYKLFGRNLDQNILYPPTVHALRAGGLSQVRRRFLLVGEAPFLRSTSIGPTHNMVGGARRLLIGPTYLFIYTHDARAIASGPTVPTESGTLGP
jgi:hypothetical protein